MLKLFLVILVILEAENKVVRHDEICGEFDGRRMYLELGEYGILESRNQTKSNLVGKKSTRLATHNRQCTLELITCPSCIISVKFTFLNISRNCGKNPLLDSCGCDYVWLYEPPFEEVSGEQFCGHFIETNISSLEYKSQTRSIAINFLYSSSQQYAFTLVYSSERNRHFLDGYPKYSNMNNGSQFISSPFFPYLYPRDLSMEYVINCKTSENCKVRLIFTDFQISSSSLIEFFDWNGQRMYVATGSIFRPPILISSGPSMVVRFYANGGSNLGFKASYVFLLGDRDISTLKPDTDCGGFVNNLGGAITMMNMIKEGTKSYDCFWILHPPESYLHLKTQLYLKLITFSDFAGSTELIVRQGVTSNEPVVEVLRHPVSQHIISKQKEHVVAINQGFYVSLKGLFSPDSRVAIIYTAYNYRDCYSATDFLCRNLRCIPSYLICDGFDHCGDNSDETTNCVQEPKERMRWAHTPNFYFPKIDRYQYLKTATIVFVVCSLGLMTLIFVLIIILYRINSRNRNQRQLQTHLQTINDMLEEGNQGITIEELIIPDDPPTYEEPPSYDDYKSGMDEKRKKSRRSKKSLKNNIRPCSRCNINDSISENTNEGAEDPTVIIDQLASTSRSCQTTPLPIPTIMSIPKTPPPTYSEFHLSVVVASKPLDNIDGNTPKHDKIETVLSDKNVILENLQLITNNCQLNTVIEIENNTVKPQLLYDLVTNSKKPINSNPLNSAEMQLMKYELPNPRISPKISLLQHEILNKSTNSSDLNSPSPKNKLLTKAPFKQNTILTHKYGLNKIPSGIAQGTIFSQADDLNKGNDGKHASTKLGPNILQRYGVNKIPYGIAQGTVFRQREAIAKTLSQIEDVDIACSHSDLTKTNFAADGKQINTITLEFDDVNDLQDIVISELAEEEIQSEVQLQAENGEASLLRKAKSVNIFNTSFPKLETSLTILQMEGKRSFSDSNLLLYTKPEDMNKIYNFADEEVRNSSLRRSITIENLHSI